MWTLLEQSEWEAEMVPIAPKELGAVGQAQSLLWKGSQKPSVDGAEKATPAFPHCSAQSANPMGLSHTLPCPSLAWGG